MTVTQEVRVDRHQVTRVRPDLDTERDFYRNVWGLKDVGTQDDMHHFAAEGSDERYVIRLRRSDTARIDVVALATESRADIDALFAKVEGTGCTIIFAPRELHTSGGGYGFRFFSADGLSFEISSDVARGTGRPMLRWDGVPQKISHIVMQSPDLEAMTAFFIDVLGVRLSDWLLGRTGAAA